MKLVITIDDDIYEDYLKQGATLPKYGTAIGSLYKALWNGTPLPEQQPCEDCIRREDVVRILDWSKASVQMLDDYSADELVGEIIAIKKEVENLLSVKPQTVTDFADKCKECGKILNETYQQKWIPVSEEPKEQGSYITTIKYGDKYAVGQRYYHGKYVGWEDSCVIAYMPLPEPYKEGTEDDK